MSFNRTPMYQTLQQLSSAEISDALDACFLEGALLNLKPLAAGKKLIGPAYTVEYRAYEEKPSSFKNAANYIDKVPAHSVIVIDNKAKTDCSTWGDILTQVAVQKNIAGTVINGVVRDLTSIKTRDYSIFCLGSTMRSGKNRVYKCAEQSTLCINDITINPGDLVFGDEDGVIIIPLDRLDEVIEKARAVQRNEAKIIQAVQEGTSLAKAREHFHYDEPWSNGH